MAFLEFLHAHLTGKDPSAIPGVFSLGSDGCLITNGPANRISDFSNLPRPAWHLCDIENFFIGMWTIILVRFIEIFLFCLSSDSNFLNSRESGRLPCQMR